MPFRATGCGGRLTLFAAPTVPGSPENNPPDCGLEDGYNDKVADAERQFRGRPSSHSKRCCEACRLLQSQCVCKRLVEPYDREGSVRGLGPFGDDR